MTSLLRILLRLALPRPIRQMQDDVALARNPRRLISSVHVIGHFLPFAERTVFDELVREQRRNRN